MEAEKSKAAAVFIEETVRLQTFLKDSWDHVAKKVYEASPDEAENLSNSSPFFRDKLAPKRTMFLLEKVFPLVASSGGLPMIDILRCQRVCKHWRAIIAKTMKLKIRKEYYASEWFSDHWTEYIKRAGRDARLKFIEWKNTQIEPTFASCGKCDVFIECTIGNGDCYLVTLAKRFFNGLKQKMEAMRLAKRASVTEN